MTVKVRFDPDSWLPEAVLSPTIPHGIWAEPEEVSQIVERHNSWVLSGTCIVHNFDSTVYTFQPCNNVLEDNQEADLLKILERVATTKKGWLT